MTMTDDDSTLISGEELENLVAPEAAGFTPPEEPLQPEHLAGCTDSECADGCPIPPLMAAMQQAQMQQLLHPLMLARSLLGEVQEFGREKASKGKLGMSFADRVAYLQATATLALAEATQQQVQLMAAQFGLAQQQVAMLAEATGPKRPAEPNPADGLLVPTHIAAAKAAEARK